MALQITVEENRRLQKHLKNAKQISDRIKNSDAFIPTNRPRKKKRTFNNNSYRTKQITRDIGNENGKWIKNVTRIRANLETGNVSIADGIMFDRKVITVSSRIEEAVEQPDYRGIPSEDII